MKKALEELKNIGTQKIHEDTHIPRASIEGFINEDFSKMNKIQLNGFIAILEREYGIDLSALKKSGLTYVEEHKNEKKIRSDYVVPKDKSSKLIYLIVALVILFTAIYFTMFSDNEQSLQEYEKESTVVESVEKEIIPQIKSNTPNIAVVSDINTTPESNSSEVNDVNLTENIEVIVLPVDTALKITHKSRRWFGYVELKTHKKSAKTFKGILDLNGSKDWLLISRPGAIVFEIDDTTQKYKSSKNMRFKYIDKKLTKIRLAEWKKLNKGRVW
jgi:hypothetical protein